MPDVRWGAYVRRSVVPGASPLTVVIEYAGRPFAYIYPTHGTGPGLQVVSDRLDFSCGLVAAAGEPARPWVALPAAPVEGDPVAPHAFVMFRAR